MGEVCRIGLDIAKNVFQVHGVDKHGRDVLKKKLQRSAVLSFFANLPPCLVGIEACGGSYYWAREISKLDTGHTVRLISPRLVKPFVINNKTDAADARAICEVVGRPSTNFVPIKTVAQQDMAAWHRIRALKIKMRTALVNQVRALLLEQGVVIPQGVLHVRRQLPTIIEDQDNGLSLTARDYLSDLYSEIVDCDERIEKCDERINSFAKTDETCKRLLKVPGIGPLIATAIVAHVSNAHNYRNGRAFASSLGLTPREYSSGGKQKLLGISKRGNTYLRQLIIQGMRNIQRSWLTREKARTRTESWLWELVARRGKYVAVVALANKTARIIWAMLARGEEYRATMA